MPTASATEMRFSGSITNFSEEKQSSVINTPGSLNANSNGINNNQPQRYPIYNEAVGVFALLTKPTIKAYTSTEDVSYSHDGNDPSAPVQTIAHSLEYMNNTQWKIGEKLHYVFNPVLDIENAEIMAAIEITGINTVQEDDVFAPPKSDSVDSKFLVNAKSLSMEFEEDNSHTQKLVNTITAISSYTPIDAFQNITSQMTYRVKRESPSRPVNSNDALFLENYLKSFEVTEARLKLIINVTYQGETSDGSPSEYTYMFTYKIESGDIDDSFTSLLYPNLPGSPGDITQYPENLFLDGINFDGSQIENCTLNGTIYTCKAWNDITLSGDFTVSTGYDVFIEAGNEVITVPESLIPSEIIRQIVPVLDYSNPMPPADETYVQNYCKNDKLYKANTALGFIAKDSTIVYEEDIRDIFAFNIFPNPTGGSSTVSITLNESAKGDLFITDMNGRTLGTAFKGQTLRGGQTEHQLPTASLASGIYLVHLFIDGERHVKRLVKQ